ncbi:MAG: hypothetical protein M1818_006366 [Claussenomyces sp. TS43310]|nr:MAG: hypothetical protein M1818_006366 [Claussenomyces sp. TS43310]
MKSDVAYENARAVENIIGFRFHDITILIEALQASGSAMTAIGTRTFQDGNKRLALQGDVVLKFIVVSRWYPTEQSREAATNLVNQIGANANLAVVGNRLGLGQFVSRSGGERVVGLKTMSATVEAIIGAAFNDGSWPGAATVMISMGLIDAEL